MNVEELIKEHAGRKAKKRAKVEAEWEEKRPEVIAWFKETLAEQGVRFDPEDRLEVWWLTQSPGFCRVELTPDGQDFIIKSPTIDYRIMAFVDDTWAIPDMIWKDISHIRGVSVKGGRFDSFIEALEYGYSMFPRGELVGCEEQSEQHPVFKALREALQRL